MLSTKLKNKILIATVCDNWQEIAQHYNAGIELDHFCQTDNIDGSRGEKMRLEAKEIIKTYDTRVLHAPFNELFPAAIDAKARKLAMDRFNQIADLSLKFGIKRMVVHSGYMPFTYFKEWHIARSIEFWQEYMEDKPEDFEICIENVLDDEPYMLAEIADGVGDKRVGLCYDVGHSNIKGKGGFGGSERKESTDPNEWLDVLAPYLKHIHLHNNDGIRDYHWELAAREGTLDIEALLSKIPKLCDDDMTITIEALRGLESFEWLKAKEYI